MVKDKELAHAKELAYAGYKVIYTNLCGVSCTLTVTETAYLLCILGLKNYDRELARAGLKSINQRLELSHLKSKEE